MALDLQEPAEPTHDQITDAFGVGVGWGGVIVSDALGIT
jgi:hypothetical protein